VSDSGIGYRGCVNHPDGPIYHGGEAAFTNGKFDESAVSERELAHTSVFHWIGALGKDMTESQPAEFPKFEPPPRKYRSRQRRSLLIACYACLARHG
jgi:hypothetical protein